MNLDILKNPIILGLLALSLTYAYMWWEEDKRAKKNPNLKKKSVSLLTPAAVGVIVWFISSSYFDSKNDIGNNNAGNNNTNANYENDKIFSKEGLNFDKPKVYKLVNSESSVGSKSYHLVGKNNIRLPSTDVFIDIAKF